MTTIRLDRVFPFDEKLSFLIPHDWTEEFDTDHYLYQAPNTDSGWLRVSLITLTNPGECSKEQISELLNERAQKEAGEFHESGENIVVAWKQLSEESGSPICNYWWALAIVSVLTLPGKLSSPTQFSGNAAKKLNPRNGLAHRQARCGRAVCRSQDGVSSHFRQPIEFTRRLRQLTAAVTCFRA